MLILDSTQLLRRIALCLGIDESVTVRAKQNQVLKPVEILSMTAAAPRSIRRASNDMALLTDDRMRIIPRLRHTNQRGLAPSTGIA